ncbi:MAG: glycosyltransferase family 39 protein [Anaerolineae bacterium]|nr:glycosyltransferase family 39 protein [Anaerolineae bacterium]MDW8098928.1 glycosyltransferase family 39 protein [Anaerolineae bacterium]
MIGRHARWASKGQIVSPHLASRFREETQREGAGQKAGRILRIRPRPPIERRTRWILLGLILIAWAVRLYRLDAQSLWYDEGVTAQVARQGLVELTRWTADDIQPPLYYYVVAGWIRLAGASEWGLRFPSAAWGVLIAPLMYVLGRRLYRCPDRTSGQSPARIGLVAALLASGASLYVYYSQEARMYTQLTALGLVVTYALVRAAQSTNASTCRCWWGAFTLAGLAAVYTHYFAFFLLIALLVATAFRLSPTVPPRSSVILYLRPLIKPILAFILIGLGYLPWLPFVLHRYRVDASYWQGQLKLDEALRHIWISFTLSAPQVMLEADAIRLGWGFAVVTALAFMGLLWRGRDVAWTTAFLFSYLLVPVALILILSSRTPKFNPRYLMLASPALWLLIAGGLHALARPRSLDSPISAILRVISLLALAFVLAAFAWADRSWFTDPRFTKPDFRRAAAFIRTQITADEMVLLVSGHMSPVWDYYAGDLPRLRLPDIDVLDVNAVLSYDVGERLARALAGKQGAWLVLWQDEVVDPNGIVADILEQAGEEVPVDRSFWHVGVRHFRWSAGARFTGQPPIAYPARINFGGQLWLLGHSQRDNGELRIYWQAQRPLSEDLKVTGELVDAAGHVWGRLPDRRLAAYEYPTFRWQPGQVVLGRYALPSDPGTPPGDYMLRLSVYPEGSLPLEVLDASGAPQGQSAFLSPVRVSQWTEDKELELPAEAQRLDVSLAPGLTLLGIEPLPEARIPGDGFTLKIWWRAESLLAPDLSLRLWWRQNGQRFESSAGPLTGDVNAPSQTWPAGALVRGQHTVRVPLQAPTGKELTLYGQVMDGEGQPTGEALALGTVRVAPVERISQPPLVKWPSGVTFEGHIRLVGVDAASTTAQPGATIAVTVVWQAVSEMNRSYTAFVHLLGPDGRVVAQEDHVPGRGARPTTSWWAGEIVVDRFELTLPTDLPIGEYRLEVGLYEANRPGLPRLHTDAGGDAVRLGKLLVR